MQSPLEKSKAMPSVAPIWNTWSYAAMSAGSRLPAVEKIDSPHEFDTMSARWLSTISASAASRSLSKHELAATVTTLALGAKPCAISTSSASSELLPKPQAVSFVHCDGVLTSEYWPGANGLSPWLI